MKHLSHEDDEMWNPASSRCEEGFVTQRDLRTITPLSMLTTPVTKPTNRDEYKEKLTKSIRGGSRLIGNSASALQLARIDSYLIQSDVILSSPEF